MNAQQVHQYDRGRTALLPRTLPVQTVDDLAPHHWVINDKGNYSLRRGAPPKAVVAAAAEFANGKVGLGDFLDRIGVPKAKA